MNKIIAIAALIILNAISINARSPIEKSIHTSFKPGEVWSDNNGVHINAHGGGILYDNGRYYWYGEHKGEKTSAAKVGVKVYSSTDLYNWNDEGVVLPVRPDGSGHILESGCVVERPKVIYNEKTKKYVMWFHLEHKGKGYTAAEYGVAVSDSPTGEFEFLYNSRSCAGVYPLNMSKKEIKEAKAKYATDSLTVEDGRHLIRDFEVGQMSRDMTLYVDDDGKAYHIFASEENSTLHIVLLTDDYLHHTDKYIRTLAAKHNEAPAIFKRDGVYWMISSGCTGWNPNEARLSRAEAILGSWESLPNPCQGDEAELTFRSQSTYILPVANQQDAWIFMADRWTPKHPIDGRYIWLPIEFKDGVPQLNWHSEWDLSIFEK